MTIGMKDGKFLNNYIMKEFVKTIGPIIGGLLIGDGIANIEDGFFVGIIELISGLLMISCVFFLIFKK